MSAPEHLEEKFQILLVVLEREKDLAIAGLLLYELVRTLKFYVKLLFNERGKASKERKRIRVGKVRALLIPKRVFRRPVTVTEIKKALLWATRRIEKMSSSKLQVMVENFSALMDAVYRRILSKFSGEKLAFRELVSSKDEAIDVFLSILFLEKDGKVEVMQESPFGEIYILPKVSVVEQMG